MSVLSRKKYLTAIFMSVAIPVLAAEATVPEPPRPQTCAAQLVSSDRPPVSLETGPWIDPGQLPQSGFLEFNTPADAFPGQQQFCLDNPTECFNRIAPMRVHLTADVLQTIRRINHYVNSTVTYEGDQQQYGVPERWTYPTSGKGDCEDYQLLKQKLLREAGIPLSSLRQAIVIVPSGLWHDVLVIRTDRGDFVIENGIDEVRTPAQTGYKFVEMESPTDDYKWVSPDSPDWHHSYLTTDTKHEPVYFMPTDRATAFPVHP